MRAVLRHLLIAVPIVLYWAWQGPILYGAYKDYRHAAAMMKAPKTDKYLAAALQGHGYSENGVEQESLAAMEAQARFTDLGSRMAGGFFLLAVISYVLAFFIDRRRGKTWGDAGEPR